MTLLVATVFTICIFMKNPNNINAYLIVNTEAFDDYNQSLNISPNLSLLHFHFNSIWRLQNITNSLWTL
jgi:hypothetical protein